MPFDLALLQSDGQRNRFIVSSSDGNGEFYRQSASTRSNRNTRRPLSGSDGHDHF
jgi:hypothetical protein